MYEDDDDDEQKDELEEDVHNPDAMHIGSSLAPPEARLYNTAQLHGKYAFGTSRSYSSTND